MTRLAHKIYTCQRARSLEHMLKTYLPQKQPHLLLTFQQTCGFGKPIRRIEVNGHMIFRVNGEQHFSIGDSLPPQMAKKIG